MPDERRETLSHVMGKKKSMVLVGLVGLVGSSALVSGAQNQGVSCVRHLSGGPEGESPSKLIQGMGKIQFLKTAELGFLFSCWLSAGNLLGTSCCPNYTAPSMSHQQCCVKFLLALHLLDFPFKSVSSAPDG